MPDCYHGYTDCNDVRCKRIFELEQKLESESLRLEICQKALRDAELQKDEMGRHAAALRAALLRFGTHPDSCDGECQCGLSAVLNAVPSDYAEKRSCSGGECKMEEGHDGDHVLNLRRRCICPNGTRTAIAHVNGCPAGGG